MNYPNRHAHDHMFYSGEDADYPALRLCQQDAHAWIVVPEVTPQGWDVRDNRGSWARSELHLLRSPHSSNTPLNPRIIGTLPAMPAWDDDDMGATAARLADIPVCPSCFFHLYPLEIFTMASVFVARGRDRWDVPWRKSPVHLVDGQITHAGHSWGEDLSWHVHLYYENINPHTGSFVKTEMGGTGDSLSLKEIITRNEGRLCAKCLFRLFPECTAPLDPNLVLRRPR